LYFYQCNIIVTIWQVFFMSLGPVNQRRIHLRKWVFIWSLPSFYQPNPLALALRIRVLSLGPVHLHYHGVRRGLQPGMVASVYESYQIGSGKTVIRDVCVVSTILDQWSNVFSVDTKSRSLFLISGLMFSL